MKKRESLLAACVAGSMICGITPVANSQEPRPAQPSSPEKQNVSEAKPTRTNTVGEIFRIAAPILEQQASIKINGKSYLLSDFQRQSEMGRFAAAAGTASSLSFAAGDLVKVARDEEIDETIPVSKMAKLEGLGIVPTSLARSTEETATGERSINPDIFSRPRIAD
ncbi:MAG TPA: hypothetical protein VNQ76_16140 [Planctomicrobium sp.]|nr:hypothetical protein [Planctomicrobium sp.]